MRLIALSVCVIVLLAAPAMSEDRTQRPPERPAEEARRAEQALPPATQAAAQDRTAQTQGQLQNAVAPIQNAGAAQQEEKVEKQVYIYSPAGRRDPMLSIITASKEAAKKKKSTTKKFVPPVEDYDVSQFRLIAVVVEKTDRFAMVGLPDNKYYTIREGMRVGVNEGKVTKILPDGLVVREFVKDYRGKLAPKDTIIKLRKEEE